MKSLKVQVSDEIASKIEHAANDLGISVEELLQRSVDDIFGRNAQFESAASRVLEKNAELYRRLGSDQ